VLRAVDVRPGTPLARVDTSDVERAVGRLAPVADVEVQRSWPGTLRVTVTERVAVAGVLTRTSATLVDATGVPFATERRLPEGVVRIEVPQVQSPDDTLRAVLQVHRALPEELSRRVFLVRAEDPSDVVLLLRSGLQVVWGAPGDDATKAAAALALGDLPGTVIDVSAPGVVVRR
jgi:cell division protein FtsQ